MRTAEDTYYIEPTHRSLTALHRVFRESDKIPTQKKCGKLDSRLVLPGDFKCHLTDQF